MHDVVVLALPDTIAFDLATPLEVLGRPRDATGRPLYRVRVAGSAESVPCGPVRLVAGEGLDALDDADTIVLPGREDPTAPVSEPVLAHLRGAHARGARLVSICVGAFTLAATGLLDGRRATTHWAAAELFRTTHPAVALDPKVLYVDEGRLLTSAGATAGIDLCLHLVGLDHGAAAAADAARLAVSPRHREGGQAQYIPARPHRPVESLEPLLRWLTEHSHHELALRDIAVRARMSERTLTRRFREETGRSPLRWLSRTRVHRAQELPGVHRSAGRGDRPPRRLPIDVELPRRLHPPHRSRTPNLPADPRLTEVLTDTCCGRHRGPRDVRRQPSSSASATMMPPGPRT